MPKRYYRMALSLLVAWLIIASAGSSQTSAGANQASGETSVQVSAETNTAPASASAAFATSAGRRDAICPMIEAAARTNGIPVDFFARVIWEESRFRPYEVGPVTRSGRAQGIAQFMPGTAAERGLLDPFNPVEALPKSGEFLAELRDQFGNLGLAAAAYNAGPQRVRDFVAGLRGLPHETRNYVRVITGRPVEYWADPPQANPAGRDEVGSQTGPVGEVCSNLVARLKRTPSRVFNGQHGPEVQFRRVSHPLYAQQQRNVPYWCRYLHHPKISVCGSVRQ